MAEDPHQVAVIEIRDDGASAVDPGTLNEAQMVRSWRALQRRDDEEGAAPGRIFSSS